MCICGMPKTKEQNKHEWQHAQYCWSYKKTAWNRANKWVAKPLAEANVCRLKQLTWITSHANRMQIFSGLPSLQHACFFVPVFSLYTFTPSCPLLVGTVTLRYIYVCTLYLKLCNIILLLLFIPNNWLMETFKWNLVPYFLVEFPWWDCQISLVYLG